MFNIKEELKKLPEKPGVYIMKDKNDNILYVGKAIILKNRLKQYFQKGNKSVRIEKMVSLIDHFEYIVVDSEVEALILEANLIKLHKPKYNVLLKDDKMYPYIKLTINDDFPTLRITRKKLNDGAKYYGPYTNVYAAREIVDFLNLTFKLKQCNRNFSKKQNERPCLNYHIKKCSGICIGNISKEEYDDRIKQIMMFLEGKFDEILDTINKEMKKSALNLNFEKAAELRDIKVNIENLNKKQKMDNFNENYIDVIGIVKKLDKASIQIFFIRNSKMIGGENFILRDVSDETEEELFYNFIKQFYNESNVPSKIMFKYDIGDKDIIKEWLCTISKRKNIEIKIPKKGEKLRFIEMAERNAEIALKNKTYLIENENILISLMELLNLKELPLRIESYDISNISGTDMVAGIVVFENAKPKRGEYRRLKIKTVEGQNDIACMKEVLSRRLKYCILEDNINKKIDIEKLNLEENTQEKNINTKNSNPFGPKPNLILIDGGITQVRATEEVINEYKLNIPVYGMIKNDKHKTKAIVNSDNKEFNILNNKELFNFISLLQEEVHRTAISYHRKLREKKVRKSILDEIEGIGEKRKKALIKEFKSIKNIKKSTPEEISNMTGININIAKEILNKLNNNI